MFRHPWTQDRKHEPNWTRVANKKKPKGVIFKWAFYLLKMLKNSNISYFNHKFQWISRRWQKFCVGRGVFFGGRNEKLHFSCAPQQSSKFMAIFRWLNLDPKNKRIVHELLRFWFAMRMKHNANNTKQVCVYIVLYMSVQVYIIWLNRYFERKVKLAADVAISSRFIWKSHILAVVGTEIRMRNK